MPPQSERQRPENPRRLSPALEDDWPGERDPGELDAELANRPVDTLFIQAFRQALLAGRDPSGVMDFFDDGAEWGMHAAPLPGVGAGADYDEEPSYPLILFSGVIYPPDDEFAEMLQHFWAFQSSTRFLSRVPRGMFKPKLTPSYLLFAMACLGTVFSPSPIGQQSPEAYWWTATALMHGNLEVDNREARNFALVIAWILLETYGALHANPAVWHRTNITQGYVETATRRMFPNLNCNKPGRRIICSEDIASERQASSIMSYFLLIDLLRAIHYGLSANLTVAELFIPLLSVPHDLNSLYKSTLNDPTSLPAVLSSDDILLLLVALLADINILGTTFLPLTEMFQDNISEKNHGRGGSNTASTLPKAETPVFHDPYLPFSPQNEASRATQQLTRVLDAIGEAYLGTLEKNIITLYHVCRMLLALPALQALVVLTGYPPRTHFNTIPEAVLRRRVTDGLRRGEQALESAWLIFESLGESSDVGAVWLPHAIFYAGIVVWGMIAHAGAGKGMHGSLRVLSLFCDKLDIMRWPCCRTMAEHLRMLMTRGADLSVNRK